MNKITSPIGSTTLVCNTDVTSYILSGWTTVRQDSVGHVLMRKVR